MSALTSDQVLEVLRVARKTDTIPDLRNQDLSRLDLSRLDLSFSSLSGCRLRETDFSEARLTRCDLSMSDLSGALFRSADLTGANLAGASLRDTCFSGAIFNATVLANVDLRPVKGLETVRHSGPSTIGVDTVYRSNGRIPASFLRASGVPDDLISHLQSLPNMPPIGYYSVFISYSSRDREFVEQLYRDLQAKGVRCWFAQDDMRIGDSLRLRIDSAIRAFNKLLVVLSRDSIHSQWVEREVEIAQLRERESNSVTLFPLRIDDAVMETTAIPWLVTLRRTRHIADFSQWKDQRAYALNLDRLLRDLRAEEDLQRFREGLVSSYIEAIADRLDPLDETAGAR